MTLKIRNARDIYLESGEGNICERCTGLRSIDIGWLEICNIEQA